MQEKGVEHMFGGHILTSYNVKGGVSFLVL